MLTYSFADRGNASLYEHLYRCIRADIERGVIAAGEKLPSKRALARHLGVSLITVEGAYSQLMAEGYVTSEPRRGYYACDLGASGASSPAGSGHAVDTAVLTSFSGAISSAGANKSCAVPSVGAGAPSGVQSGGEPHVAYAIETSSRATQPGGGAARLLEAVSRSVSSDEGEPPIVADLTGAGVPLGMFPYGAWAKSMREALACESERALVGETEAAGSPRLRRAIADHLRGFRGMDIDPAQIVVGAGSQVLYNALVQFLGRGLRYGVEDPGYPRLASIYRVNDVPLSFVPLDGQGVDVSAVRAARVDVMHVMPSHQYPTGLVASIGRRYELLAWANEQEGRFIVEDDYDCEFRLAGRPIPALQSIDATGRVIYANTFAKSLGPAFRIGYVVLPERLLKRFSETLGFYSCTVSAVDQLALARFIEGGDYERHVSRMRTHYRAVRDALIGALRAGALAGRIGIAQADSGIHFVLGIKAAHVANDAQAGGRWDDAFVRAARREGVAIRPLSAFFSRGLNACAGSTRRFLVSYSSLPLEVAAGSAEALARATASADAETGATLR